MTFRRFIKLIREYPYLLNDTYVRSTAEAREMFHAYAPTLTETVARAKARADLPDEAWTYLESLAERVDRKQRKREQMLERMSGFLVQLRLYRRTVIVCAILVIVVAYFTLFPSGRTIAKNIFERMLTIADRSLEIESPEYLGTKSDAADVAEEDYFYETSNYASVSEYIAATGFQPFHIDDARFTCTGVTEMNVSDEGRNVWINYLYKEIVSVGFHQEWLKNDKETFYSNGSDYRIMRVHNTELLYYYDSVDGSFNGITSLVDGSILHIHISLEKYVKEILSILF